MKRRGEIQLTPEERDTFLALPKACTLATIGPKGFPQLTAMWFALIDGKFHFATYGKSQKVKNLERNPRCSVMLEDGQAYAELRGYCVEGEGELIADPDLAFRVLCQTTQRYVGFDPLVSGPEVEQAIRARARKRSVIRVNPVKEISWDHRKLGGGY
jgi:PPOX class probable F420-dependent enzyme